MTARPGKFSDQAIEYLMEEFRDGKRLDNRSALAAIREHFPEAKSMPIASRTMRRWLRAAHLAVTAEGETLTSPTHGNGYTRTKAAPSTVKELTRRPEGKAITSQYSHWVELLEGDANDPKASPQAKLIARVAHTLDATLQELVRGIAEIPHAPNEAPR